MWIAWLAGGYLLGKYGRRLLDVSIHGEGSTWTVYDGGPNVDGPFFRTKQVTVSAKGMGGIQQAANQMAQEWYGSPKAEQVAGGPYSGPFSVINSQGEWWLRVEGSGK